MQNQSAFTLAELLIALAILGVIATFTIPKVLLSQQNGAWNAATKEAAATISGAFQAYQSEHALTPDTNPGDLTPYMNYVRVESTGVIDNLPGSGSLACVPAQPCIVFHNGGKLKAQSLYRFGQPENNHYIYFTFDPDGKYCGNNTGPGKSITIDLYYNGRVSISGRVAGDTTYQGATPNTWGNGAEPDWWDGWQN